MARITAGPPDAKTNPEGHRTYRWPVDGVERELLSVTSIRKLVGEPYGLVNWQINKIVDRALTRDYRDWWNAVYMDELGHEAIDDNGQEYMEYDREPSADDLLRLRKWLREASTEERDAAANKGLDIHGALEMGFSDEQANEVTRPYLRQVRHFLEAEDMEIAAQEFQCFNLSVGYAGTGDVLLRHKPTGRIILGDWKTSKSVYVDHVVQLHAYIGGEFIGKGGVVNEEQTAMLQSVTTAGILHLKADSWTWHEVPFSERVLRAFFGSAMFAQLLAAHRTPDALFSRTVTGRAPT